MENLMKKVIKQRKKMPKYCCICKGVHRGKVVDDRTISLHRFPQNKRLKRTWIQRCKTVMRTFKWSEHKRLCSEHFIGFGGPTMQYTLPSLFQTKSGLTKDFPTWKLAENQNDIDENDGESAENPMDIDDNHEKCSVVEQAHLTLPYECHSVDISLHLHDYCHGQVSATNIPHSRVIDTQTECDAKITEVQTYLSYDYKTVHSTSQTETLTNDFGVQCNLPVLTFDDIKHSDDMVSFYTGIPNRVVFESLVDEIKEEAEVRTSRRKCNYSLLSGGRPRSLSVLNEFFMVLMRLRLGLLLEDLSFRFCISTSQCSNIVERWVNYLVVQLSFLVEWTPMEIIKANMSRCFKEKFPNTRVIVDCTELFSKSSNSLLLQSLMYSDYKSHIKRLSA